jgi:hypothetical protein
MACGRELAGLASYMDDGLAGRLAGGLAGQFCMQQFIVQSDKETY